MDGWLVLYSFCMHARFWLDTRSEIIFPRGFHLLLLLVDALKRVYIQYACLSSFLATTYWAGCWMIDGWWEMQTRSVG